MVGAYQSRKLGDCQENIHIYYNVVDDDDNIDEENKSAARIQDESRMITITKLLISG